MGWTITHLASNAEESKLRLYGLYGNKLNAMQAWNKIVFANATEIFSIYDDQGHLYKTKKLPCPDTTLFIFEDEGDSSVGMLPIIIKIEINYPIDPADYDDYLESIWNGFPDMDFQTEVSASVYTTTGKVTLLVKRIEDYRGKKEIEILIM